MEQNNRARSKLEQPFSGYPGIGAAHEIIPQQSLRHFLADFSEIADKVFETDFLAEDCDDGLLHVDNSFGDVEDEDATEIMYPEYDSRKYFMTFSADRMSVNVFEMQKIAKLARATRSIWEKNDLGAVEKDAKNEISRRFPTHSPKLLFNSIANVGGRLVMAPRSDVRQKIALVPDPAHHLGTFDMLNTEHGAISDAITKRIEQGHEEDDQEQNFIPWDYMPHATFAAIRKKAKPRDIIDVLEQTKELIASKPLELALGKLMFRHQLERRKRP